MLPEKTTDLRGDIHGLDSDNDGTACEEALPQLP